MFFLILLTLDLGMNGYFLWKTHLAFPQMGKYRVMLMAWVVLMVVGPFLVRMMNRGGFAALGSLYAMLCYCWLAVMFWFFCWGLLGDFWNLANKAIAYFQGGHAKLLLSPRIGWLAVTSIVAASLAWSLVEAQHIQLNTVSIRMPHMPPGSKPIRIAQISDLHLGGGTGMERLEKVVSLLKQSQADMIIASGDMIDGPYEDLQSFAAALVEVQAPLGKYAVNGNHEYYSGLRNSELFHDAAGFRLLRQEAVKVLPEADWLFLAGMDDPHGAYFGKPPTREADVLAKCSSAADIILIKHRPEVDAASVGKVSLQLSGHTHGGQIFPFMLVTRSVYHYWRGLYEVGPAEATGMPMRLFVNRGAGTWGPPMRLLAQPEVVLFILEPA